MAVQTGRTVNKYIDVIIDDSGGTIRSIPVDSIGGLALPHDEVELFAFQDAIKGVLLGLPNFSCTITGPWDTTAVQTVGTLSGSHTVLNGVNGLNVPLTFDVQVGMRHAWEAGEPQFGITSTAANGMLVSNYEVDLNTGKYSATIRVASGSTAPAWGTAAEA